MFSSSILPLVYVLILQLISSESTYSTDQIAPSPTSPLDRVLKPLTPQVPTKCPNPVPLVITNPREKRQPSKVPTSYRGCPTAPAPTNSLQVACRFIRMTDLKSCQSILTVNICYSEESPKNFQTIPHEIGFLTQLTQLSLVLCYNGTIPSSISCLTNLNSLSFSSNKGGLTGTIPSELARLTNLNYLQIFENKLNGSIPSSFSHLTRLTSFYIAGQPLSGKIPSLPTLTDLEYLNLQNIKLGGSIPSFLSKLTNLISLDLSDNQLIGTIPTFIAKMKNLAFLRFKNNQLTGSIPSFLWNMTTLGRVVLSKNKLIGTIPNSACRRSIWNVDCAKVKCSCCRDYFTGNLCK